MAQDMPLSAALYFHNCRAVLTQGAGEDEKHENMQTGGLENMTSRTFAERGRFPEVKALLFLRGEVPEGP